MVQFQVDPKPLIAAMQTLSSGIGSGPKHATVNGFWLLKPGTFIFRYLRTPRANFEALNPDLPGLHPNPCSALLSTPQQEDFIRVPALVASTEGLAITWTSQMCEQRMLTYPCFGVKGYLLYGHSGGLGTVYLGFTKPGCSG